MNTPLYVFQKRAVNHSIVCVIEDVPGHSYKPETPQSDGETGYFHPVRRIIIRVLYPLHEEMNSASRPDGPDPGFEGCVFIQWMKKRGGIRRFGECRLKARECGFDADGYGVHLDRKDRRRKKSHISCRFALGRQVDDLL